MTNASTSPAARAVIYARISRDKQDEAGVNRQIRLAKARLTADEAALIRKPFVDNSVSAFSGVERPEYEDLLRHIESGQVDAVYVFKLDRLVRRTRDTLDLFELCDEHKVRIVAVNGPGIDPADPMSRVIILILGAIAEQESRDKAARVKAAAEDRAVTGRPKTGGRRMFGYEADAVTIRAEESAAIRDAATAIIDHGATLRSIVADWADRGLTSTLGRPLTTETVRAILTNPRITGLSTWTPSDDRGKRRLAYREIMGEGQWPAVLDRDRWDHLQAVLTTRRHPVNRAGAAPTTLVSSLLTCTCGDPMYHRTRKNRAGERVHFYSCKRLRAGERHVSIGSEAEPLIEAAIHARMSQPHGLQMLMEVVDEQTADPGEVGAHTARREALMARRDQVEGAMADGKIDVAAFARVSHMINEELADVEAKLAALAETGGAAALAASIAAAPTFSSWWEGASLDARRGLAFSLIDHVDVAPGRPGAKAFDPNRLQIVWRTD